MGRLRRWAARMEYSSEGLAGVVWMGEEEGANAAGLEDFSIWLKDSIRESQGADD